MGMGGISIWQLLIILVIVLLLFGTKRLKGIGTDLGNAIKGFRSAMSEGEKEKDEEEPKKLEEHAANRTATQQSGTSGTGTQDPAAKEKEKV